MKNGEKKTSEKLLLQSVKELQKNSSKETKTLIKLALLNTTPVLKLNVIKNKKRKGKKKTKIIPSFIPNNRARISKAIKFILEAIKKKPGNFYTKFNKELLLNSQNLGDAVQIKNDNQKQALIHKRYLTFFRW